MQIVGFPMQGLICFTTNCMLFLKERMPVEIFSQKKCSDLRIPGVSFNANRTWLIYAFDFIKKFLSEKVLKNSHTLEENVIIVFKPY